MREVLDFVLNEQRLVLFFRSLAVSTPVLALCLIPILRITLKKQAGLRPMLTIIALSGPFITGLWYLYNRIVDHFGLDSLTGFTLNLSLFICIGIVIGYILTLASGSRQS